MEPVRLAALLFWARCDEAAEIASEVIQDAGDDESSKRYRTAAERVLGAARLRQGRPEEAEPVLRKSLEALLAAEGTAAWQIGRHNSVYGEYLLALRRYDEAEALLREGYEVLLKERGPEFVETRLARERLERLEAALRGTSPAGE